MNVISYPRVVLGGTTFVFKYSLASSMFAYRHGITGKAPAEGDQAATVQFVAEQAAVHAHIEDEQGLRHADLSPDRIAALIGLAEMQMIINAVHEAQGKATPPANSPSLVANAA